MPLLTVCAGPMQAADGSEGRSGGGAASAEPGVAARYTRGGAILRAMEQQGAIAIYGWAAQLSIAS